MEELQQENKQLRQTFESLQARVAIAIVAMLVASGFRFLLLLYTSIRLGVFSPGIIGYTHTWAALIIGIIIGYQKLRNPRHFEDQKALLKFGLLWGGISGFLGILCGTIFNSIQIYFMATNGF